MESPAAFAGWMRLCANAKMPEGVSCFAACLFLEGLFTRTNWSYGLPSELLPAAALFLRSSIILRLLWAWSRALSFACDRKLDIVGTVVCGLFTAYGGGVLRDFLLQDEGGVFHVASVPISSLRLSLRLRVLLPRSFPDVSPSTIFLCDTLSVALYAVAGASKAFDCASGFIMSIVLGAIVGVGGGAIRDSFVGEVPGVFRSSNFYAVAAIGGSFTYVLLVQFGSDPAGAAILCVAVVLALRYLSVFFDWRTGDDPIDLTPYVSRPLKSFGYIVRGLFLGGGKKERRHYVRSFKMKSLSSEKAQRRYDHEEGDAGSEGRTESEAGSNDPLAFMR